ncbi:MAG: dTDP-4-dehydrorhamnose reductase [Alphaproteobacteria bacterium]|nr:dTDP-4-dehydrorhamnose reductase [Alphaproteobacteria bacterium]
MRALVTGSSGQVASALAARAASAANLDLTFLARPSFDLETPGTIAREIIKQAPDVVLSVAAYTAVDLAEDDPDTAMAVNGEAPGVLAGAAAELGIPILHLSTDYVFAGGGDRPFVETDTPEPSTHYGRSKLCGEQAVMRSNPKHVILRTAWVYGPAGNNFVKTMLSLAEKREHLSVVDDQVGNPTSAFDIAEGILRVLQALEPGATKPAPYGIYHMAGSEEASWWAFAKEILRLSSKSGGPTAEVAAVETSAFPTRAGRPANSRLDCTKFTGQFGHTLPGYTQALPDVIAAVLAKA